MGFIFCAHGTTYVIILIIIHHASSIIHHASTSRLISAPILHSKSLFTRHGINKEILSCFLEKRSIVLQRTVTVMQRNTVGSMWPQPKRSRFRFVLHLMYPTALVSDPHILEPNVNSIRLWLAVVIYLETFPTSSASIRPFISRVCASSERAP